jgi:hypothetical protein
MKKSALTVPQTKNKKIDVNFNGGRLTSDAGALLLQQVERRIKLLERINQVIRDPRDPLLVEHQQSHLIAQRIFSIALGYEDVNDQQDLRHDPALLASVKNSIDENLPLGSPSTISRLENRITENEMAVMTKIFVQLFIESYDAPPKEITLDFDATDDTIHGNQEGRHFNGFYDDYCFLPLYVFCGDQLLWAQLRSSKRGANHGTLAIFHCIATEIKKAWPDVEIKLRGDAGFYDPNLVEYLDRRKYKYILGFSSNEVLKKKSSNAVIAAKLFFKDAGSQESFRLFHEFLYKTKSWKRERRIIVKAERLPDGDNLDGKENTRYIVTNMIGDPQYLYENVYCARGDMENRIKEQQQMLFADRTSCHAFTANRFRLFMSSCAYVLMETIRRTALVGTEMAKAQCATIRLKLFKIAAQVKESVRRIVFSLASACPVQELWQRAYRLLQPTHAALLE